MPVYENKFDRVVFQQAALDQRFMPLIEGTIATAKMLEIPVVIEGIETLSHLSIARTLNAEYIQGYFVSRPASIPDTLDSAKFKRQLAAYEMRKAARGDSQTANESLRLCLGAKPG
jgi:EAL domain-containing protein (putative c-di-GMP-specific phosphodiesterase class I)